ncbi:MAG: DNA-processing protein DprA [Rhodospirillaceae bacterium]|nr:DNA-processing protein DprA [Rhodospirillaceae bacterium]
MAKPLTRDELIDWVRLIATEGIGPVSFRQLLQRHGSAGAALAALPKSRTPPEPDVIERVIQAATSDGIRLVPSCEAEYPALLKEISDAPPVLWVRGDPAVWAAPTVAVVGARNASLNGKKFAKKLAADLAEAGYTVVSGLARGIDGAAHEGALSKGATAAVLAGGVDVIYPPEHRPLYHKIIKSGAVLSEMLPGTEPQAPNFPRRNRIISGLARGVIVVEATLKSGSLITARLALDQGREVFAVPGSPVDPRSEGPNSLIRDGGALVRSADDVLEVLGRPEPVEPKLNQDVSFESEETEIYDERTESDLRQLVRRALGPTPVEVDELMRQCQVSAPILKTLLLEMELEGEIERLPGNRVSRIGKV